MIAFWREKKCQQRDSIEFEIERERERERVILKIHQQPRDVNGNSNVILHVAVEICIHFRS